MSPFRRTKGGGLASSKALPCPCFSQLLHSVIAGKVQRHSWWVLPGAAPAPERCWGCLCSCDSQVWCAVASDGWPAAEKAFPPLIQHGGFSGRGHHRIRGLHGCHGAQEVPDLRITLCGLLQGRKVVKVKVVKKLWVSSSRTDLLPNSGCS